MGNVLEPLPEPFAPDIAAILAHYPQRDGYLIQLFRVFANSRRFLERGTVNLLDRASPLVLRERELVILRTCANNDCEYEWGVHITAFGSHAGLGGEHMRATRLEQSDATCWTPREALLLGVVDELCASGTLADATRAAFQETWTAEEQLEILALCGNYHTISFVANVARLPGESFGARFPLA
jgi:alkylhydroperoxidase family enzyme